MTVPKAQQDPILRNFELRRFKISTKCGVLSIVAPQSMEALVAKMTELDDRARNERMPFWAELWPSSVAAARAIAKGPQLAGKRVLDFGCGVGVAGAMAAARGADVLFLDFFEEALAFASFNAGEAQQTYLDGDGGSVRSELFDWKHRRVEQPFDLVICADSVYEPRNHEHVLANLAAALERGAGGEAWVLDPMRESAEAFFERASEQFETDIDVLETNWPDRKVEIRRMRVRAV